ncbi:hypothetical protein L1887_35996 [Cichorium endivia]|nr:hypothetical protein L1887_35996 [Cichorium endivia]
MVSTSSASRKRTWANKPRNDVYFLYQVVVEVSGVYISDFFVFVGWKCSIDPEILHFVKIKFTAISVSIDLEMITHFQKWKGLLNIVAMDHYASSLDTT